ncbi:MAG: OmpP1/FadL family transporter [Thainema sp.]
MASFFKVSLASLLAGMSLIAWTERAFASGFALSEQGVINLGTAASSGAAGLDDLSTIFFNPAGLMRLPGNGGVAGAGYVIFPSIQFTDQGSAIAPGSPLSGGDGGDAGPTIFLPNLYGAFQVNDRVMVGIGVNTPFGLETNYDSDWVGRYQAIKSELVTININPTVAFQLSEDVAIGAGLNVQYADAELSNAIDFGAILASQGAPILPQQADGFASVSGDDWSLGYNVGVLYEPSTTTRIGLAYRSAVNHTLQGRADFTVPATATPLTATGLFTDTDANAEVNLPDTLSLGLYQQLSPQLALTGDLTWTNWSDFQELRISYDSIQPDTVVPENWNDTLRVALGLTYDIDETWTVRGGVAYDPTPVPQEFFTARIPDSDRTWLSVGLSYAPTDNLSFDFAYTHVFIDDRNIDRTELGAGTLVGEYNNSIDIVGAQLNWQF